MQDVENGSGIGKKESCVLNAKWKLDEVEAKVIENARWKIMESR